MQAKTTTPTAAEANEQLVLGAIEAAVNGDAEGFLDVFHPDAEVLEPDYLPYGGTYRGREEFLALWAKASQIVDLSTLKVVSATCNDERVVPLMTAKLVNGEEHHITEHWRIENGLVREIRVFWFGLPS